MSAEKLLNVKPRDLSYTLELKKQPSCSVKLSNKTQDYIAYKVMTTSAEKYRVRPNIGILSPGSSCDILVIMLDPFNIQRKDKFLIMGVVACPDATKEDIQNLFNADVGRLVQRSKLGVAYVLTPEVPLPVAEESTSSSFSTSSNISEMSAGELLDIHPSELRFRFEVKELSCSLQMSNMTENRVGFKVKATHPDKYFVQPNIGIVLPLSTCDITVRIRAQTEILLNMQCMDKFLIQSIVASPVSTSKDITPEMFNGTAGAVDEIKLGVFYVSPSRSSFSEGLTRYLFRKGIIIGLLCPIVLYLIWKMLPLVWSLTFLVMKLVVKMMQKLVSDSVEDWIVNICTPYIWALFIRYVHFLPMLFGCSIPFLRVLFRRH
ncbi:hypothetical protein Pfo_000600 [Paulownia fortunei]|nr:hypothetical protein Pfo_000600 [Paulownia fortunei]